MVLINESQLLQYIQDNSTAQYLISAVDDPETSSSPAVEPRRKRKRPSKPSTTNTTTTTTSTNNGISGSQDMISCPVCKIVLHSTSLQSHLEKHLKCTICNSYAENEDTLHAHYGLCHPGMVLMSSGEAVGIENVPIDDGMIYTNENEVIEIESEDEASSEQGQLIDQNFPVTCVCGEVSYLQDELDAHIQKDHFLPDEDQYVCSCGKKVAQKESLRRHFWTIHKQEGFRLEQPNE